jgi:hypothetical protein
VTGSDENAGALKTSYKVTFRLACKVYVGQISCLDLGLILRDFVINANTPESEKNKNLKHLCSQAFQTRATWL